MPRLNREENQGTGCLGGPRKAIAKGGKAAGEAISAAAKGAAKAVVQKAQELRNEASENDSEQTPLAVANTEVDFSVVDHRQSVLVRNPDTRGDAELAKQFHKEEKEAAGLSRPRERSAAGQESRANTAVSRQWFEMDGGVKGRKAVSGAAAAAAAAAAEAAAAAAAVVKARAESEGQAAPKDESSQGFRTPSPTAMDLKLAALADDSSGDEDETGKGQ